MPIARFFCVATGVVVAWIIFQFGWMTAHVFNATRFILYDQGSYLYAVGRWQAGEALYRDFSWQYGPLALGWYRAFAALGGNTPLTLVLASSSAFAVAWLLTARLVLRVAGCGWGGGLAVAGLLPIMSSAGVNAINGPHGAIEMLILALIAWTLMVDPSRVRFPLSKPCLLGILAGTLQWVRFGPHTVAIAAILVITVWQRWPGAAGPSLADFVREIWRFIVRLFCGYILCVGPLCAWYFIALPPTGAWEQLWPIHMVECYAVTYPNRWPKISSVVDVATLIVPVLLAIGLAVMLIISRLPRRQTEAPANARLFIYPDTAAAGVLFFPLYYALGSASLFRNDYALLGHLWLVWPGLALGALLVRGWMRALVALAIAPAIALTVVAIPRGLKNEQAWRAQSLVLPNGQSLWFRPGEAARFNQLKNILDSAPPTRRLAVFIGGGGVHHFFGTQRVGRHWWFLPEFVRPWETDVVLKDILRHDLIFVTDLGQNSTTPTRLGVVSLWLPLPKGMPEQLIPHLKNHRHIEAVGDLLSVQP